MLEAEEYIEQAYLFRVLCERLPQNMPLQDLLKQTRDELLATTRLPMAIDFLRSELEHTGAIASGMVRLAHYFTPYQTYVVSEAENERGRFDLRIALEILRAEAVYRSEGISPQGLFLFQFETLSRNRLRYDPGLGAIAEDPAYGPAWREWILTVRKQIGLVEFSNLLYLRSEFYQMLRRRREGRELEPEKTVLFGEKEGRIAHANLGKDPLYLFAALQRHLHYPPVPRPKPVDETPQLLPQMMRRLERLEARIKLLEEEERAGIDITKFYRDGGR